MEEILAELDVADPGHPDTWLTHEGGWTLTAYETGLVMWDHEDPATPPRHMVAIARARVLQLWTRLAAGLIGEIEREPWSPGSGIQPPSDEQKAEIERAMLEADRQFYDSLGVERDGEPCRAPECSRGAVRASVFCRPHQFENVRRRLCPFKH